MPTAFASLQQRLKFRPRPGQEALAERIIRSPLGAMAQGPWLDPVALFALRRLFFPLSRLWAAAGVAQTSVPDFVEEARLSGPILRQARFLARLLERHRRIRQHAGAMEEAWREAMFGSTQHDATRLALIEENRLAAAHRLSLDRGAFYPLLLAGAREQVRWQTPRPDEVDAIYGHYLADPSAAYAFPETLPAVEESNHIAGPLGPVWWVRFDSPSQRLGDRVYAKILEPRGVEHPPTLILGNGVCMEPEMMRDVIDAATIMCRLGFRIIEITSPWHGRRCPPGWFGGEQFFATAPLGQLDLFTAQARETAVLINWCRRRFGTPVALSGISLGSFVAQLVATHSIHWPAAARPDALLLVTHTGRMEEVVFESGLVESIGLTEALEAAGWTQPQMLRWAPLLNPVGESAVPAERIVSILGTVDRVTPIGGGLELVQRWEIPPENLFVMRQGHFGTPVKLIRDDAPLRRLKSIIDSLA